jgi:hypothetical protein
VKWAGLREVRGLLVGLLENGRGFAKVGGAYSYVPFVVVVVPLGPRMNVLVSQVQESFTVDVDFVPVPSLAQPELTEDGSTASLLQSRQGGVEELKKRGESQWVPV